MNDCPSAMSAKSEERLALYFMAPKVGEGGLAGLAGLVVHCAAVADLSGKNEARETCVLCRVPKVEIQKSLTIGNNLALIGEEWISCYAMPKKFPLKRLLWFPFDFHHHIFCGWLLWRV